jgi:hypothetical protein
VVSPFTCVYKSIVVTKDLLPVTKVFMVQKLGRMLGVPSALESMLGMLEKDFFPSARKDIEKDGKV